MIRATVLAVLVAVGIVLVFETGILVGTRSVTEVPRFSMQLDKEQRLVGFRLDRVTGDVVVFGLGWDPPVIVLGGDEAQPVTLSVFRAENEAVSSVNPFDLARPATDAQQTNPFAHLVGKPPMGQPSEQRSPD